MSVIFDQLRISDNGQQFYINAHVNMADYFENAYIECITIKTADKISESNPKDYSHDFIYRKDFPANTAKEVNLVLTAGDFDAAWNNYNSSTEQIINPNNPYATESFNGNLSSTLFFVYIKVSDSISPCTPCTLDEPVTVGVTFDTTAFYQRVMGFTRELADTCNIPKGFIDTILNFNAFKAAVETDHYCAAKDFYEQLFESGGSSTGSATIRKGCGCHG